MNILIVDDSRLARKELVHTLKNLEIEYNNLLEAGSADEADAMLDEHSIDLILLDIDMPGRNGFEFLEERSRVPKVIFVTAFDQYAVKAFEANALDYVTKPVHRERLEQALNKVHLAKEIKPSQGVLQKGDRVFVKDKDECWFVPIETIFLIESEGNYARIYFENHSPMLKRSLNSLEDRLDSALFFRANRTQIVNIESIKNIEPWFSNSLKIYLKEGYEVETSRRQAQVFREMMGL